MTADTAIEIGVLIALLVSPTILATFAGRAWVRQQEDRRTIAGYIDTLPTADAETDIDAWTRERLQQLATERHHTIKEMYP